MRETRNAISGVHKLAQGGQTARFKYRQGIEEIE